MRFFKIVLATVLVLATGFLLTVWRPLVHASSITQPASDDPCFRLISAIPSGLHCVTVTLTQAQILAMCDPASFSGCSPAVIVAAPGAGNVVFPFAIRWALHFNSNPYISSQSGPYLWWQNNVNAFNYVAFGGQGPSSLDFAFHGVTPLSNAAFFINGLSTQTSSGVDPASYSNQPLALQALAGDTLNRGPALSAAVSSAGSGYAAQDIVVPFDPLGYTNANLTVTSVNGGGGVLGLSVSVPGYRSPGGVNTPTNLGNVTSATVTAGHAGHVYSNGDTGTISGCGDGTATYTVLTSTLGVVNTVSVAAGTGYLSNPAACATTVSTGSGDGTLELDTLAGNGSGLTLNLTVQPGDSTLTVTVWYTVAAQ